MYMFMFIYICVFMYTSDFFPSLNRNTPVLDNEQLLISFFYESDLLNINMLWPFSVWSSVVFL